MNKTAVIIGGGLAGVEAAIQLARRDINVLLYEMKPKKFSPAHKSEGLAELVCSNSFKAERLESAAGLLKAEMQLLESVSVECALQSRVPAGGALAVDREAFSALMTKKVEENPNIRLIREEVTDIPSADAVIIAAGPLASEALSKTISDICGTSASGDGMLSFYDAAAPVISADSIDMERAFTGSRYGRGGDSDYINCPLNKEEYELFHHELINAKSAMLHEFDVYEGCMPIEVLAKRGLDAIRYGPMKPVGLTDPKTGGRAWAVLQLRRENLSGTMYNLVGFQTNLKFAEQKRVFSLIPALKNAEFERFGVMHRNSFINSPRLLKTSFALRERPDLFFAGQITGVEGYMESAASGIMAGINAARLLRGEEPLILPNITMTGALAEYVCAENKNFQPMGATFGLLPPLDVKIRDKRERYAALAERSLNLLKQVIVNILLLQRR